MLFFSVLFSKCANVLSVNSGFVLKSGLVYYDDGGRGRLCLVGEGVLGREGSREQALM